MNMARTMVYLGLATTLALGGCAAHESSRDVSRASSSFSSRTQLDEDSTADKGTPAKPVSSPKTTGTSDGGDGDAALDVIDRLPYKGMPAEYIDQTWLGAADEVGEQVTGGKLKGSTPYYWNARNGTDDRVFAAYVKNGEVIGVAKYNMGKNYWGDGSSVVSSDLPDLEASGESVGKNGSASTSKPDPDGWDDAEDYADANSSQFKSWDEAYEYWLEEMS